MKYIKKFESEISDDEKAILDSQKAEDNYLRQRYKDMKKYLFFKDRTGNIDNGTYFILEKDRMEAVYDHTNLFIVTNKLYTYNLNTDKLKNEKRKDKHYNLNKYKLGYIMTDSDNLQDLLDYIPALKHTNKFNL